MQYPGVPQVEKHCSYPSLRLSAPGSLFPPVLEGAGSCQSPAEEHNMDSNGKPSTVQVVLLAGSSALTAFFYSVYRKRATTVARLKVNSTTASPKCQHILHISGKGVQPELI